MCDCKYVGEIFVEKTGRYDEIKQTAGGLPDLCKE